MKRMITLFLLLLLVTAVSADTISDINLRIGEDGYTLVEERVIFENEGDYGILAQPPYATELSVSDQKGNLTYELTDIDGTKALKIDYREHLNPRQTKEILLRYGTHYLTTKDADLWTFNFSAPTTAHKTIVRVTYPQDAKVLTIRPSELLRTYVEEGVWVYPQEDELNFTSTYQYSGIKSTVPTTSTTIPNKSWFPFTVDVRLFYGIVLGIVVLTLAAIIYTLYKNRNTLRGRGGGHLVVDVADDVVTEPKVVDGKVSYNIDSTGPRGSKAIKESIIKMLDENELAIVRLLENAEEDEVTQAYIYKTTGIPKSSLSDILRHIEKRNIIERRVEGRVKWIKLKTWVLE